MDNNTQDPGLALDIAGVMNFANRIIKKVESRSGLNIPEDKKDAFNKAFKDNEGDKLIVDLKAKMQELKDKINKSNGANQTSNR